MVYISKGMKDISDTITWCSPKGNLKLEVLGVSIPLAYFYLFYGSSTQRAGFWLYLGDLGS